MVNNRNEASTKRAILFLGFQRVMPLNTKLAVAAPAQVPDHRSPQFQHQAFHLEVAAEVEEATSQSRAQWLHLNRFAAHVTRVLQAWLAPKV